MNCVLKYPGAKWGVASWVISFFPPHHSYLEPFFGSGGVFFNKSRSNIETINDLDGEVVNLFECIRSDPERLARDIYFTPYARASYDKAFSKEIPKEPFGRAARLLIRCNMGHGFRTTGERVGWKNDVAGRERAYAAKAWTELPDIIAEAAERLRGVQIECSPAAELISRFNASNILIYCDPPYVLSTRRGKQYRCEMTDDDHLHLRHLYDHHPDLWRRLLELQALPEKVTERFTRELRFDEIDAAFRMDDAQIDLFSEKEIIPYDYERICRNALRP